MAARLTLATLPQDSLAPWLKLPALARRGSGGRCMFNVIFALGPVALTAASLAISFPGPLCWPGLTPKFQFLLSGRPQALMWLWAYQ